jgi:heavy metal sensor kinase
MNGWSIRARLTVWFAAMLAAILIVLSGATWWALRDSVRHTIDENLANRVDAVARFLNEPGTSESFEELREDLREYVALDPGWTLIRIRDAQGVQLYRSEAFDVQAVATVPASPQAPSRAYQDLVMRGQSVRLLTSRATIRGQPFVIEVAWPAGEWREVMDQFGWAVLLIIPFGILAAAAGGYWISRRALAPVDRLTTTARAITANQLSRRIDVPATGDELQRLSETLNEMLARLETAFAETTRFTADASHELRTPVSIIRTSAEVALRRPRSAETYCQALEVILREAERTSALVQDLLVLTRADAGVDTLQRAPVDLGSLLEGLRTSMLARGDRGGIEVRVEVPGGPVIIEGDAAALGRLMLILVDNAVTYSPAPGLVRVWLRAESGGVVLGVDDSGMGIAGEDLPRVFDRFYRADKARSRESGGAGLGLSIAKGIVERHAGCITIESEAGKGCRVRVEIPAGSVSP